MSGESTDGDGSSEGIGNPGGHRESPPSSFAEGGPASSGGVPDIVRGGTALVTGGGSSSPRPKATWAETVTTDDAESGRLVKEYLSESQADWANIPWDLLGIILTRCPFRDGILATYKTVCEEWAMMPNDYLRRNFPADDIPVLLHYCSGEETLRFYDPISSVIFEVDYPRNSRIGRLCDFRFQKLLTMIPDGVLLINILTGAGFCWEIVAMPSDCYVLSTSGESIKAVIAMKGSGYSTTVAILKKFRRSERTFGTDVTFTVSSITNPVLRNPSLFCLSTKGALGVFDLASNIVSIYGDGQEEDDEDSDEGSDSEDSDDDDFDVDEENRNRFARSAEFLCESSEKEIHRILLDDLWQSARVKKLEEPGMKWADVEHLGDNSIFTGTRCSVISTVPAGQQNKVFLPGYYGAPPILKANLVELQGRLFFSATEIKEIGTTSSPWSCTIGEGVCSGETGVRKDIANSIWVQLRKIA